MDARKESDETEDGRWEPTGGKIEAEHGKEKKTRRQRKSFVAREESQAGGEVNHGKVLRSHTRRNTEKIGIAATEWVSSKQHQHQQRSSSKRGENDEGERRKEKGGGTAVTSTVIALSPSCQQSSNERSPPEQAELGGTTSQMKTAIEDSSVVQTGSYSTQKGSTMGEVVGRARKSKRNEASFLQSSPCSGESAPTSLLQANSATISQHSQMDSIVGTGTVSGKDYDDDDDASLARTCSIEECKDEEMNEENAEHSLKESSCSSTPLNEIFTGKEETRVLLKVTGGSVGSHWSPPTNSSDQSEHDEDKEEFKEIPYQDDDEEELATSLKTLACDGQSETNVEKSPPKNSVPSCAVINFSTVGFKKEVPRKGTETAAGDISHRHRHYDEEEWQVAPHTNDEGKSFDRISNEREKQRIVLSPCRRTGSNMIQSGVEATPAGTEAPCPETTLTRSPKSPQSATSSSSVSSSKKKSSHGASKKRCVADRPSETPSLFKFKKPQNSKKGTSLSDSDDKSDKSDNAVLGENAVGELLRSVVEPKKTQMSSVLMSNLPYMGELTFDTRPRRGRKPKKADICHLISKNYGIYFPSASQVGSDVPLSRAKEPQKSPSTSTSATTRTKSDHSSKSRHVGRGGASQSGTRGSPTTRPLLLPSTVPAFYNRDVSIVPIIPSTWNTNTRNACTSDRLPVRAGITCSVPATNLTLHRNVIHSASSQETISMFPFNTQNRDESGRTAFSSTQPDSDDGNSEGSGMDVDQDDSREKVRRDQDTPLNLCLRDDMGVRGDLFESMSLGNTNPSLDVRWGKGLTLRINPQEMTSSSDNKKFQFESIPPSLTIFQSGKKSVELSALKETASMKNVSTSALTKNMGASESGHIDLVSRGSHLRSSTPVVTRRSSLSTSNLPLFSSMRGVQHQIGSEISVSLGNEDMSSISFAPRAEKTSAPEGNACFPRQSTGRKKKDLNLRTSLNSPVCPSSKSISTTSSLGYSPTPSSSSTALSSLGGQLFGQSSGGINDGAEVSICKFKFTGGAKPSLQEKKMLSVDSGGNFRFYTDKTNNNGVTTKLSKSHQFAVSSGSSKMKTTDSSSTMGKLGGANELPPRSECPSSFSFMQERGKPAPSPTAQTESEMRSKTKKGPLSASFIKSGSKRMLHSAPSISSSSTSGASQAEAFPLLPTRDESKYFRLSMDGDQGPTTSSRPFPFQVGDDSNSSSNSCTSSDESNDNTRDRGNGYEFLSYDQADHLPSRSFEKHATASSNKMKLRRKRRTRKSLMREKLEKTFKEKGFLIQTQQLESAEGATYCKFRQLRKFTRYLFRSWKDYLPDNVKEISDNSVQAQGKESENPSMEESSTHLQANVNPDEKERLQDGEINLSEVEGNTSALPDQDLQEDEVDVEDDPDDANDEVGDD